MYAWALSTQAPPSPPPPPAPPLLGLADTGLVEGHDAGTSLNGLDTLSNLQQSTTDTSSASSNKAAVSSNLLLRFGPIAGVAFALAIVLVSASVLGFVGYKTWQYAAAAKRRDDERNGGSSPRTWRSMWGAPAPAEAVQSIGQHPDDALGHNNASPGTTPVARSPPSVSQLRPGAPFNAQPSMRARAPPTGAAPSMRASKALPPAAQPSMRVRPAPALNGPAVVRTNALFAQEPGASVSAPEPAAAAAGAAQWSPFPSYSKVGGPAAPEGSNTASGPRSRRVQLRNVAAGIGSIVPSAKRASLGGSGNESVPQESRRTRRKSAVPFHAG